MLRYGGVSVDEQEVTIRLDAIDGEAHVCSTWPMWSRKLEKRYGMPPKYQERGAFVTVAFWTLPLRAVSLRSPKPPAANPARPRPGFGRSRVSTPSTVPVERPKTANRM
jgi:hypothetical protein